MKIANILSYLESIAPLSLQEDYDNAGLLTGNPDWNCSGILICLDVNEQVIQEAISEKCNLVIAHHPLIFKGIKKLNGKNQVEKTVIGAIKNDIAIYAIHTNLDNVIEGVNGKISDKLGLKKRTILFPMENTLKKLFTFVPEKNADQVRDAVFHAGGGQIGNYSECSFNTAGMGTFKAGSGSEPYLGKIGERHAEQEIRIEVIFPAHKENAILSALKQAHPYEEVAYEVINVSNKHQHIGSGIIGELENEMDESVFLQFLKKVFEIPVVRHSSFPGRKIKKVAVCGGAGSFLITSALSLNADAFVTADLKYHEFFNADGKLLLADVGHFESEQYTIELLHELLVQKFPTFAVLKTGVKTNPVNYFI